MTTLIAIEATALDAILKRLDRIDHKLEGATIVPRAEWLTVKDAAQTLGVKPDTIRRKAKSGEIQARGTGKCRMVKLVD
ncbi:MAG: helix-turn-helix domain-containing protein [Sulfitobacter sp.]|jgi:excisionase family DNA binding protein